MQAAFKGHLEYLRNLLRFGAPVNACDYDRRTAAHLACAQGSSEIVMLLAQHKADFRFTDRFGLTPMDEVGSPQSPQMP